MNRIVIELAAAVGTDGLEYATIGLGEPAVFGSTTIALRCAAEDPAVSALLTADGAVSVPAAGGRLYEELVRHPDVRDWLQAALQAVEPDRYPVYIKIKTPHGVEALPWEALYKPHAGPFLGLDDRWSLTRMVDSQARALPGQPVAAPIRIVAVLSCLGVPADGELAALRRALAAAGDIHAQMLVLSSERRLVEALQTEIDTGGAPGIEVDLVPDTLARLQRRVADYKPHLLHLFCHGTAEGEPYLSIAIVEDWRNPVRSSLLVDAGQFRGFASDPAAAPWLIVLNCCEGALAAPGTQSLALSLVRQGAAPAVIGMRRPTVADTAKVVAEAVLETFLDEVLAVANAAGAESELHWPDVIAQARRRLVEVPAMTATTAADSTAEWTVPVLYVRPEPFIIRSAPRARRRGGARGTRAIIEEHLNVNLTDFTSSIDPIAEPVDQAALIADGLRGVVSNLPPGPAGGLRASALLIADELTSTREALR